MLTTSAAEYVRFIPLNLGDAHHCSTSSMSALKRASSSATVGAWCNEETIRREYEALMSADLDRMTFNGEAMLETEPLIIIVGNKGEEIVTLFLIFYIRLFDSSRIVALI